MFQFLRSFQMAPRVRTPRRARPRLELLEGREVPANLSLDVTYGEGRVITLSGTLSNHDNPSMQTINVTGQATMMTTTNAQGQYSVVVTAAALGDVTATVGDQSATNSVTLTDVTPTLTFNAAEGTGQVFNFSGTVTYARPKNGLVVTVSGTPVTLQAGHTTNANAAGDYSVPILLNGTESDNGTAQAKVTTGWGTVSAWASAEVQQSGT